MRTTKHRTFTTAIAGIGAICLAAGAVASSAPINSAAAAERPAQSERFVSISYDAALDRDEAVIVLAPLPTGGDHEVQFISDARLPRGEVIVKLPPIPASMSSGSARATDGLRTIEVLTDRSLAPDEVIVVFNPTPHSNPGDAGLGEITIETDPALPPEQVKKKLDFPE